MENNREFYWEVGFPSVYGSNLWIKFILSSLCWNTFWSNRSKGGSRWLVILRDSFSYSCNMVVSLECSLYSDFGRTRKKAQLIKSCQTIHAHSCTVNFFPHGTLDAGASAMNLLKFFWSPNG